MLEIIPQYGNPCKLKRRIFAFTIIRSPIVATILVWTKTINNLNDHSITYTQIINQTIFIICSRKIQYQNFSLKRNEPQSLEGFRSNRLIQKSFVHGKNLRRKATLCDFAQNFSEYLIFFILDAQVFCKPLISKKYYLCI